MKRLLLMLVVLTTMVQSSHAVLKEENLEKTLSVLRLELIKRHQELSGQVTERRQQNLEIRNELIETMNKSNQNSLMLYSQNSDYVFDLTYACHEATTQYQQFQRKQLPFKEFLNSHDAEIAKFDSLVTSLRMMPVVRLSQQARTDRNVCLTLATNIRSTLMENRSQTADYIRYYQMTEQRLKNLNDYALERYSEIQTGIFMNGSDSYFYVLKNFPTKMSNMVDVMSEKYSSTPTSQWDSKIIFGLFFVIIIYIIVAIALNLLVVRYLLPKRYQTGEFLKKRPSIIMTTTTLTFTLLMVVFGNFANQNFFDMASGLLVEYSWLLSVVLISLLLRVSGEQISSAFRIYSPLLLIGFLVISFRIILIPKELVNIVFPGILLLATIWQWKVIRRHNKNVPRQDMFYTYISLTVFLVSLVFSWGGYTLLAVQVLIWWIMQLTCILTITCLSRWLSIYSERKNIEKRPITQTWHFLFVQKVVIPLMAVFSVMISLYWAADVFNLSDLCWQIFRNHFVDMENLQLSILKLTMVICLWFLFSYIASTLLAFMEMHFSIQDPTTAASRAVMSRNIVQVLVWGIWLLISLGILHISLTWLLAISGGLSTGIGFASKNIIENIFYGASLMAGRLKVGDWIEVDGTVGKVQSISYTSTIVESLASEIITFQNSQLFDKNYKNLTRNHGYVVVPVLFGVAYGSNLQRVQQLVDDAVNNLNNEWMDTSKKASSIVVNLNDSSVDLKIVVWAEVAKRAAVASAVLSCIYDTLNANGIEIPFPQRDVHIINN